MIVPRAVNHRDHLDLRRMAHLASAANLPGELAELVRARVRAAAAGGVK